MKIIVRPIRSHSTRVFGGGLYFINISSVMKVGVFRTGIMRLQVYGSLLFLFKRILLLGFATGFITVIVFNFGMMSGVDRLYGKINFQTRFWWIGGNTLLLLEIFVVLAEV